MDFLIEFLAQLVIQFIVEVIFESVLEGAFRGLARAVSTSIGRQVVTVLVGAAFGVGWGWHLADRPDPPKLLWVSVVLAGAALALMRAGRDSTWRTAATPGEGFWRRALSAPWNWPPRRWLDFAILNVAIAGGIVLGYSVG